ncbi:hypothetical protein LTR40_003663 [Exophiala xenobiotica]|nr:hypothetical protein LTR40_003663 [Exophiala xenobiotica]KAK5347934.1 hypothetical protein LTR61_008186 [Exophiala xenobiotica]KAK5401744.1 hypothetical protein LTR06_010851 [Exophiala xenobiotica]
MPYALGIRLAVRGVLNANKIPWHRRTAIGAAMRPGSLGSVDCICLVGVQSVVGFTSPAPQRVGISANGRRGVLHTGAAGVGPSGSPIDDPVSVNHLSRLTMHFCHLTRLSKTMTLVVKIARIWASSGWGETPLEVDGDHGDASSGSITLRDALKIRFSQNPQTARELAWHAAQILRLHRAYPSNTPHEPLSAFFAGLYLWSFAKYYYTGHGKSELKGSSKATATRLDSKPSETKLATTINEKDGWVQCGGRAVLHYVGDLSLAAAPGKILCECAAIMRQLKIWGIAGRLIDFLIVMLRREEKYTENIQYAAD